MVEIKVDDKIYEVYARDEHSLKKEPHIRDKANGEVVQNQISLARKYLESIGKFTKDDSNTHWHIEQILKTQIQKERDKAENYMLNTVKAKNGEELVELSLDNVAKVEAMINTDSNYNKQFNEEDKNSSAYDISKELKPVLLENKSITEIDYKKLLEQIIIKIDNENTAHLTSDGCGREQTRDRLLKISKQKLIYYLKEPIKSNFELINIIAEKTKPTKSGYSGKRHLSFASKFCHYLCFFLFKNEPEQDNYSIYDNILRIAIPKYLNYYGIEKISVDDYKKYFEKNDYIKYLKDKDKSIGEFYKVYYDLIGEIIKESGSGISRNGFDHLLWYYFKGR